MSGNVCIDNFCKPVIKCYRISIDIERGEGTYTFTLKEKYNRGINDVTMTIKKENFGDKVTNGVSKVVKDFFGTSLKKDN